MNLSGWAQGSYHTLKHCMSGDTGMIIAMATINILLVLAYAVFAYMAVDPWRRTNKTVVSNSVLALGVVFLFCALSGYFMDFLRTWWPAYKLQLILKIILFVSTIWLIHSTKKSNIFSRIMGQADAAENM